MVDHFVGFFFGGLSFFLSLGQLFHFVHRQLRIHTFTSGRLRFHRRRLVRRFLFADVQRT